LKNNCENGNTYAHGDIHLVVLAHLRRRWSLSGREGFGFFSPSRRACKAGFSAFSGNKIPIFHCARGEKRWRKSGMFISEKLQPDAGLDAVQGGPARPVNSSRGQRHNAPRVCDQMLVWPNQHVRLVHLGAKEKRTWWRDMKRTRWHVQSRATGRV
jgi:hypothetical protein